MTRRFDELIDALINGPDPFADENPTDNYAGWWAEQAYVGERRPAHRGMERLLILPPPPMGGPWMPLWRCKARDSNNGE